MVHREFRVPIYSIIEISLLLHPKKRANCAQVQGDVFKAMKASSFVWCMLALLSCLASATAFVCSPLADSARRHVQACGTEARLQRAGFGGAPDRCRQQQPPASRLLQPRASSASRTPARVPPMRMGGVGVPGGESLAEQEYEVPNGCRRLRIPTVCRQFTRAVPVAYTPVCLPFSRSRLLLCLSLSLALEQTLTGPDPLLSTFCNANVSHWDLF